MRLFGRWKRAAVGAASVVAAMALATGCGKKASSPDQRYKEAEQKQVKEFTTQFTGAYETTRDNLASDKVQSGSGDIVITLEDGGKSTLSALMGGTDLSWIKTLGMKMSAKIGKSALEESIALSLNDKALGTMNLVMSDNDLYLQIPELADKYMHIPGSVLGDSASFGEMMSEYKKLPEGKKLDELVTNYTKIITDAAKDVKESKEDVTVGDYTVNATKLEATFDGEQLTELGKKIVETAKNDQNLADIIKASTDEATYEKFKESLEKEGEQKLEGKLVSTIWLGEGDKVIARELRIENANASENYVFTMKAPNKGEEFASEITFSEDGNELFRVDGKGKNNGKKMSGEFTFTQEGSKVAVLTLDELDLEALKKSELTAKGSVRLESGSSSSMMDLSAFAIDFDLAETAKSTKGTVALKSGDTPYVTIAIDTTRGEGGEEPSAPSDVVDVSDDAAFEAFMKGANWSSYLGQLRQTDIPSNYLDMLEQSLKASGMMQ